MTGWTGRLLESHAWMDSVDLIAIREKLLAALREDLGAGDITSRAVVDAEVLGVGHYAAKQGMIVCGLTVAAELARLVDPGLRFREKIPDGTRVAAGSALGEVRGSARSILALERTSLNVIQRLSGIATVTSRYVAAVVGTPAEIIDTRKTAPGLRELDKYAVRCGGGLNHRIGLFDGVLIKNNHLEFHDRIQDAIGRARRSLGGRIPVEVEVRDLEELSGAIEAGADIILLDNFTPRETARAVEVVAGRIPLESSGGITLENVAEYAAAGVDYISVGALTHSVVAADVHLRVAPQ